MQDIWVGDDGDFLKLGLLRHLIAHGGDLVSPIGVNWYYRPTPERVAPERQLDPELYDSLQFLSASGIRTVPLLQLEGLLSSAVYYCRLLDYPSRARLGVRRAAREAWHAKAREVLDACPCVFLDPDNGLEPDEGLKSYDTSRFAHVLWSELRDWYSTGKTVVVFQHARRVAGLQEQLAQQIKQQLGLDQLPLVVRRGPRWLYVIPAAGMWPQFTATIDAFKGKWAALRRQSGGS